MRQSACLVFNTITVNNFASLFNCTPVGRAPDSIQRWPRHKAIYFSWLGPELLCPLLDPPGFNCWFSFVPVFQWCCSTPRGSRGVGRNTFLSSPHLCFIIVFICFFFFFFFVVVFFFFFFLFFFFFFLVVVFLFCFPWWSIDELENPSRGPNNCMFWAMTEAEGEAGFL